MEKQKNRVAEFYNQNGYISRNYFFNSYPAITRLGAVIHYLNKHRGWKLKGEWIKDERGVKDFIYRQGE